MTAPRQAAWRARLRPLVPNGLHARLHRRRIRGYVRGYRTRTISHNYGGFGLTLHLHDPLAEGWYDRDWQMPAELGALARGRLRPGARVFDVGAHQGVVALVLGRIVGGRGAVIAVEAEAHNARVARLNADANRARNVTVVHAAAAARGRRSVRFVESLNGRVVESRAAGSVEVIAVSLDELAERYGHPDVVLIDVEGYEGEVLRGAHQVIGAARSDFCVEVHEAATLRRLGGSAEDIAAPFLSGAYEVCFAVADDTPPGIGERELAGDWAPLRSSSDLRSAAGRRFFLLARGRR